MPRCLALLPVLLLSACAPSQLVWEKPLAPGLTYREEVDRAIPRVVHALRISTGSSVLRLMPELAGGAVNDAVSGATGRAKVAQIVAGADALAGVNGDFFVMQTGWTGHPLGLMVRDGELVATPNPKRTVFAWGPETVAFGKATWEGALKMGGGASLNLNGLNRVCGPNEAVLNGPAAGQAVGAEGALAVTLRLEGTLAPTCTVAGDVELVADARPAQTVERGTAILVARGRAATALRGLHPGDRIAVALNTTGFDWERIDAAIGGGPTLLQNGETAIDGEESGFNQAAFVAARHARTAVGRTADGDLWLVAVDSRPPTSVGASLPELATIMRRLGCVDAMNLDGGGSTTLVAMGLTLNRPSDGLERQVANGLVVRGPKTEPMGKPRLVVPATIRGDAIDAKVLDERGLAVPNARVVWAASGSVWIDQGGRLRVLAPGPGIVQASVDGQVLTAKVTAAR